MRKRWRGAAAVPWLAAVAGYALGAALAWGLDWASAHALTVGAAHLLYALLQLLGMTGTLQGAVLHTVNGIDFEIGAHCLGLEPLCALTALLCFDVHIARRRAAWACAGGALLLLAVNLTRLVSLYAIASSKPQLFPFAHDLAWESVLALAIFTVWQTARWGLPKNFAPLFRHRRLYP